MLNNEQLILWWKYCLTSNQQIDLIKRSHPGCEKGSGMLLFGLHVFYTKNPEQLYKIWLKDNG